MTFKVADLCRNHLDSTGVMVEQVYTKVEGLYAVYRTEERIVIQFSDDQAQGADQRKSLSDLYVPRGEIDTLLDEMRETRDKLRLSRARRYERRLADALTLGLQGQSNQALAEVERLKQDLLEERKSSARQFYLLASLAVGAPLILLIALLSSGLFDFGLSGPQRVVANSMWFAAAVGTVGAFFSTAMAIRNREIEPSISLQDTMLDAGLRMLVGALSGALVYALVKAGAFAMKIGNADINDSEAFSSGGADWLLVLLVAFIAGFLERLVPNLLAKASAGEVKQTKTTISSRSAAEDAASSELNPLGQPAGGQPAPGAPTDPADPADESDDPESGEDLCTDRPGTPEHVTQDVELPETLGGVEEAPVNS